MVSILRGTRLLSLLLMLVLLLLRLLLLLLLLVVLQFLLQQQLLLLLLLLLLVAFVVVTAAAVAFGDCDVCWLILFDTHTSSCLLCVTQCAAVRTYQALTMDPPQPYLTLFPLGSLS